MYCRSHNTSVSRLYCKVTVNFCNQKLFFKLGVAKSGFFILSFQYTSIGFSFLRWEVEFWELRAQTRTAVLPLSPFAAAMKSGERQQLPVLPAVSEFSVVGLVDGGGGGGEEVKVSEMWSVWPRAGKMKPWETCLPSFPCQKKKPWQMSDRLNVHQNRLTVWLLCTLPRPF